MNENERSLTQAERGELRNWVDNTNPESLDEKQKHLHRMLSLDRSSSPIAKIRNWFIDRRYNK